MTTYVNKINHEIVKWFRDTGRMNNKTLYKIVLFLNSNEDKSIKTLDISNLTGINANTVAYSLRILRSANIVLKYKNTYSLNKNFINDKSNTEDVKKEKTSGHVKLQYHPKNIEILDFLFLQDESFRIQLACSFLYHANQCSSDGVFNLNDVKSKINRSWGKYNCSGANSTNLNIIINLLCRKNYIKFYKKRQYILNCKNSISRINNLLLAIICLGNNVSNRNCVILYLMYKQVRDNKINLINYKDIEKKLYKEYVPRYESFKYKLLTSWQMSGIIDYNKTSEISLNALLYAECTGVIINHNIPEDLYVSKKSAENIKEKLEKATNLCEEHININNCLQEETNKRNWWGKVVDWLKQFLFLKD